MEPIKPGFLRLAQIVGRPAVTETQAKRNRKLNKKWGRPMRHRDAIQPILPISRSSFLAGVKSGKYPSPVKLGPRTTVWRSEDIQVVLDRDWPAPSGPAVKGKRKAA